MQAILTATGQANKLRPLTTTMPAPMLPVVDRPVMVYAVELLARAGCRDIIVHLPEQASSLIDYFGNGARWNVNIRYLAQQNACGTANLFTCIDPSQSDTVIVLPADAIVDLDIEAALAFHQKTGSMVTAVLGRTEPSTPSPLPGATKPGAVDSKQYLQPVLSATAKAEAYAHTGAFLLEPAAVDAIADLPSPCHTDLLAALQQTGMTMQSYVMDGYWNLLTTFQDFQAAQNTVLASLAAGETTSAQALLRHPYVEAGEFQPGVWVAPNSIIHPSVRLTPPLFIGAGCRIGRDVELGPNTILGAGVVIDDGVTIQHSTVLSHTYVGQYLHLAQRIAHCSELIDVETGINIEITDPWLLNGVTPTLSGNLLQTIWESLLALTPVAWASKGHSLPKQPEAPLWEKRAQVGPEQSTRYIYRSAERSLEDPQPVMTTFQKQLTALGLSRSDRLY
ncbi:MAG: NDP-sugar synthase [Caldilineaceae bacterium]